MPTTGETIKQVASIVTQVIVIGGALISIVAWTSGYVNDWIEKRIDDRVLSEENIENLVKNQLKESNMRLEVLDAHATHPTLEIPLVPTFGEWVPKRIGSVHQAETDGFLVAQSGGPGNVPRFNLWGGDSESNLIVLTRGVKYGGATLPVRKGGFYQITIEEEIVNGKKVKMASRSLLAYWLPVAETTRSSPATVPASPD